MKFLSLVRNANGDAVPLDAISTIKDIAGPEFTLRYNEYRSAQINGAAAPGYSSNQAMNALLRCPSCSEMSPLAPGRTPIRGRGLPNS